ncbi:MAG: ABC transporter substrate-binding protein [Ruminococcaceae bacterium]|nr:ABC transporter substrate-binding protein [Oscillospiraceae bacterium]
MKKKVACPAVILLCIALCLTGCQANPLSPPSENSLSVVDALGREVLLPLRPKRVAALLGSFAHVWTLAGGELCAAAEDAGEDFGIDMQSLISIGGAHSPNLELLLSADPDLVLASASTASHVDMRETLEVLGIPVVYFRVDRFDDYLHMLKICTDLTGRSDLYELNGTRVAGQIRQIKTAYAATTTTEDRRRVLLLRTSSGSVKAKGSRGTILGEMLADFACINIADSETVLLETLSLESIMLAQPYRIFVVTMGNDTEAALASLQDLMESNSAWGELAAVKAGRIHVMDKTYFNLKPNHRWGEAYKILYEILVQE